MTCEHPLVSVFLPYYNDEKYLRSSIESVLHNQYQNFELILLNHASTDNSRTIAHSYSDRRIIHIDMDTNYEAGGGILFEKMLGFASGRYIKPLCADDILRPEGLVSLVTYMETHGEKDFAFGNVEYIDHNGKDLNVNWFSEREDFNINNDEVKCLQLFAYGKSFLPYVGSIIKRSALASLVLNKTYVMLFDVSLWVSLLCAGKKIGYLDTLVCSYRIHMGQVSSVAKEDIAGFYFWIEAKTFYKLFLSLHDIGLAKRIWPESRYGEQLKYAEDIPFFVSHNMLLEHCHYDAAAAYLDYLLNNKSDSERIKKRFGYTTKEYRKDLMRLIPGNNEHITEFNWKNFKQKIYSTSTKQLGWIGISFLLARKVHAVVTLRRVREKSKHKKKFSL